MTAKLLDTGGPLGHPGADTGGPLGLPAADTGEPSFQRNVCCAAETPGMSGAPATTDEDMPEGRGALETLRASALRVSWELAQSIKAELAPSETRLNEVCLFEEARAGPSGAPPGVRSEAPPGGFQGESKPPGHSSSSSSICAAAAEGASGVAAGKGCEGGSCGAGPEGEGCGGCLHQGDVETAAAAGFCSWCCCAFPRLSFPQVSQCTIRRLFLLQRHNYEVAGVRWLCAALQPSGPREAVGAAVLADDPGMGRTSQALMLLSLGYQLGAFKAPSLVVVSGGPCSSSSSSSSSSAADLLQLRRWVLLAKEWAPCLAVKPLLGPEDAQGALLPLHPEGGSTTAAATAAAAAAAPSISGVHTAASEEPTNTEAAEGPPPGGPSAGLLYLTTFAALGRGPQAQTLKELRRRHEALALLIIDTRCRRQCGRYQQQQQQQQQQDQETGDSALCCCSALASELSVSYAAMAAVDECWEAPGGSPRGKVKKLLIAEHSNVDSYASLRLLLPHLLPKQFSSPQAVDELSSAGRCSAYAAKSEASFSFARRCAFPLVLRRCRTSVLLGALPPTDRKLHLLALAKAQAEAYTAIEAECSRALLAAASLPPQPAPHAQATAGEDVHLITQRAVAAMRAACVHPALVTLCSSSSSSSGSCEEATETPTADCAPLVSAELLERVVDALVVAAPPSKNFKSSSSSSGGSSGRRETFRRRVGRWKEWEVLHVALQLGLVQHCVVQQQMLQRSSKLAWLSELLETLRTAAGAAAAAQHAKAEEAAHRRDTAAAKVLLLNPLPLTCGGEGSVGLLLRDLLRPRPLCIDTKDSLLSATQKIRDFKKAQVGQVQVLLVEDVELLLQLPPHVFAGIRQVVWLAPSLDLGAKGPQASGTEASFSAGSEGCAALTLAVEQRLMSVANGEGLTVHYLVCLRTLEECYVRPKIRNAPPFV